MDDLARRLPATRPLQWALRQRSAPNALSWEEMAVGLGVCARTLYRLMAAREVSYVVADEWAYCFGSGSLTVFQALPSDVRRLGDGYQVAPRPRLPAPTARVGGDRNLLS